MKNKDARSGRAPPAVELEEYDFSRVPKSELRDCCYYEYLRESAEIIKQVIDLRRQLPDSSDIVGKTFQYAKVTKALGRLGEGSMLLQLTLCRRFPEEPWQRLSDDEKKWVRDLRGRAIRAQNEAILNVAPMLVIDTLPSNSSAGEQTLNQWIAQTTPDGYRKLPTEMRQKAIVSGFFQINLEYPFNRLMGEIRSRLKTLHKGEPENKMERRGRRTERDWLNALGALRLRYFCRTLTEAQKLTAPLASNDNGMHYSDRTAWNRACNTAVKHFRQILQVPDVHLPIHFTEGWRK